MTTPDESRCPTEVGHRGGDDEQRRQVEDLDDGTLDPDEFAREPDWSDEGTDDE